MSKNSAHRQAEAVAVRGYLSRSSLDELKVRSRFGTVSERAYELAIDRETGRGFVHESAAALPLLCKESLDITVDSFNS